MDANLFDPAGAKLLLVDDTPANLEILAATLKPEGYKIAVATSGEQAIKVVAKLVPDLIFLDVMMPGMDGYQTCRELKANTAFASIPVIFITAKTQIEDVVEGFDAGGVDYITKPFRRQEVLARARTHLMLQTTLRKLMVLNEQKNKFLGMVAHDLRNPISAALGYADMIAEDADPTGITHDMARKIVDASRSMMMLVDDLLDAAAIESGKFSVNCEPTDLKLLISDKVDAHQYRAKKKNIAVHAQLAETMPISLDKHRIGQVLDNLLSNAIKFSPQGATIRVSLESTADGVSIIVADQGPGMDADDLARLGGDFQSLSAKPTAGEKSTGLGLAIAKKVIDAHAGSMQVTSKLGEGAAFCVLLKRSVT